MWYDETFFTAVRREIKRSANGMKLRGISGNVISVACGTDGVHSFFIDEHTSKPSKQSTWESYSGHIKPGTLIIHDGENSHSVLIERIPRCTEEVHKSDEAKKNDRRGSPLQPIDNLHSLLKRFMREHSGFKRDDLQGWLNLFAFIMNPPYSLEDKIIILLQMAVYHRKRVKYREAIGKKRLK